jgi:hypothetical protein
MISEDPHLQLGVENERPISESSVLPPERTDAQQISTHSVQPAEIRQFSAKRARYASLDLFIDVSCSPFIIAATGVSRILALKRIVPGHKYAQYWRHRLTLANSTCPGHPFSDAHHPDPYVFVHPGILQALDVSDFSMLCYGSSLIPSIATLEPKVFVCFLLKKHFDRIRSTVPVQFFYPFNFQQHSAFPDQYDLDDFCLLNHSSKWMARFPFPDMRTLENYGLKKDGTVAELVVLLEERTQMHNQSICPCRSNAQVPPNLKMRPFMEKKPAFQFVRALSSTSLSQRRSKNGFRFSM